MKILYISHMYPNNIDENTNNFFHEQVMELQKLGCDITVISPIPQLPIPFNKMLNHWKEFDEIPLMQIRDKIKVYYPRYKTFPSGLFFSNSGKRMYVGVRDLIKHIIETERFDIIHSHVALPDGQCGGIISRENKIPLITTIHGQDFNVVAARNAFCEKAIGQVLKSSSEVVVVSQSLANKGAKFYPTLAQNFKVIHNGVNDLFLSNIERYVKKETSNSDFIMISVSGLIPLKGINYNIDAVKLLIKSIPNFRYYIIGVGKELFKLKNRTKRLGLESHIVFLGRRSQEEIKEYFSNADVFSLPSWNEAFGLVYLEAMASGLPVIGCLNQGVSEFVTDGENGFLVSEHNTSEIVDKVLSLYKNKELMRKVSENAIKTSKSFTWTENARANYSLYKKVTLNTSNFGE